MGVKFGASLHILHCYQIAIHSADDLSMWAMSKTLDTETSKDEREWLDEFLISSGCATREGIASDSVCGPAFQTIMEQSVDFDLIVMGTHGRTGVARMVLGSIAEKVVRDASCPVLIVHDEYARVAAESQAQGPLASEDMLSRSSEAS